MAKNSLHLDKYEGNDVAGRDNHCCAETAAVSTATSVPVVRAAAAASTIFLEWIRGSGRKARNEFDRALICPN